MDFVNQEKNLLQLEIERLTNLVLNQSMTATAADEEAQLRSLAHCDVDGSSTQLNASAVSKGRSLFHLDLTKIKPPQEAEVRVEYIPETPDKVAKEIDENGKGSSGKKAYSQSFSGFTEPKAHFAQTLPLPLSNASKSKKVEAPKCTNSSFKVDNGLYRKLRSKMNASLTGVQGMLGGLTGRDRGADSARVLNQTVPEKLFHGESGLTGHSLSHRGSSKKKKMIFIPGVS